MKRISTWLMGAVILLEGVWLFVVLFLFGSKIPLGFLSFVAVWLALTVALFLFVRNRRKEALLLTYVGVTTDLLLLGLAGSGSPHFLDSLYRNVPNFVFLIAAHFAVCSVRVKRRS